MSVYKTLETKGVRQVHHSSGFSVAAPAVAKYVVCVGQYLNYLQLNAATLFSVKGSAYDEDGKDIDNVGTEEYVATGTTTAFDNNSAFKILGGKLKYYLRNNHTKVCDVNMMKVRPRTAMAAINAADDAGYANTIWASYLAEGLADKLGNLATSGQVMIHTENPSTGSALDYQYKTFGPVGTVNHWEVSMYPSLTIYDSQLFVDNFAVEQQYNITLKPGDEAVFEFDLAGQEFYDGIAPYVGNGLIYFDFTKIFLMQLHGHIGHQSAYNSGPLEAAATPTVLRRQARKMSSNDVMFTEAYVDVYWTAELAIEVFDSNLIQPAIGMAIDTDMDAGDYGDTIIQVIPDLNDP